MNKADFSSDFAAVIHRLEDHGYTVKNVIKRNCCKLVDALCPEHDMTGHLYAEERDDGRGVVLNCQKCHRNGKEILSQAGLSTAILFYDYDENRSRTSSKTNNSRPNSSTGSSAAGKQKQDMKYLREHVYYSADGALFGKKKIFRTTKTDEHGNTKDGKTAVWYRYERGQFLKGLNRQIAPLYNAHILSSSDAAETLYFVEGEKDVETMRHLGYLATSTPNGGGQSKWHAKYDAFVHGRTVIIITDNDDTGNDYGKFVAENVTGKANRVFIIPATAIYPEIKKKGDITDIVDLIGADDTKKRLTAATEKAEEYTANTGSSETELEAAIDAAETGRAHIDDLASDKLPSFVDVRNGQPVAINTVKLADYIRSTERYYLIRNDGFDERRVYLYQRGVYNSLSRNDFIGVIKQPVMKYAPDLLKMRVVDEVYKNLITDTDRFKDDSEFNADENIINFRNGILNIRTMQFEAHSPDVLSTIQIPCDWTGKAEPTPFFDKFISEFTESNADKITLILEYLGACISNVHGWRHKKALFFVGAGNSGKSVLRDFVYDLLGRYAASGSLADLEARFGTYSLFNKRIYGDADHSYMIVRELQTFKKLTGGDPLSVEPKGSAKFDYRYQGLLWFCMNKLPKFGGDRGEWVYDRFIIMRCNNVIPPERQDKHLTDKLSSEASGIIYMAIMAYCECIFHRNYCFTIPTESVAALEAYKIANSPYLQFYQECCRPRESYRKAFTTSKMHTAIRAWLKLNYPLLTFNRSDFEDELRQNQISVEVSRCSGSYYPFSLTDEAKKELGVYDGSN